MVADNNHFYFNNCNDFHRLLVYKSGANVPYDDSGTYFDEFDIVHHDQSIIGYGTVFCLLFILTAAIIFCFRNILYQPKLKELDE